MDARHSYVAVLVSTAIAAAAVNAAVEAGWSEGERSALQADAVLEFDGDTATMRVGAGMEPGTVLVRFDHHASDC